jgi:hypothetical protein
VETNCSPGGEAEFNRWYDGHLDELMNVDGIAAAQRFRCLDPSTHAYLALYEIVGEPGAFFQALGSARQGDVISDNSPTLISDNSNHFFEWWEPEAH